MWHSCSSEKLATWSDASARKIAWFGMYHFTHSPSSSINKILWMSFSNTILYLHWAFIKPFCKNSFFLHFIKFSCREENFVESGLKCYYLKIESVVFWETSAVNCEHHSKQYHLKEKVPPLASDYYSSSHLLFSFLIFCVVLVLHFRRKFCGLIMLLQIKVCPFVRYIQTTFTANR